MSIVTLVVGFFLASALLGFWLGWFVRGAQVKKLKDELRQIGEARER